MIVNEKTRGKHGDKKKLTWQLINNATNETRKFVSIEEIAKFLNVSTMTVYKIAHHYPVKNVILKNYYDNLQIVKL